MPNLLHYLAEAKKRGNMLGKSAIKKVIAQALDPLDPEGGSRQIEVVYKETEKTIFALAFLWAIVFEPSQISQPYLKKKGASKKTRTVKMLGLVSLPKAQRTRLNDLLLKPSHHKLWTHKRIRTFTLTFEEGFVNYNIGLLSAKLSGNVESIRKLPCKK